MNQGTDYFRKLMGHYKTMGMPVPDELRAQLAAAERAEKEADEKRAEAIADERLRKQRAAEEGAQSERDRLAEQLEPFKRSEREVWLAAGGSEDDFEKFWPSRASQILTQRRESENEAARNASRMQMRSRF